METSVVKSSTLPSYRHSLTPLWGKQSTSLAFQTRPLFQQRQPGCQPHQNSYISVLFSTFTLQYQTYLDYVNQLRYEAHQDCVLWHIPLGKGCLSSPVLCGRSWAEDARTVSEITQITQQWLPPSVKTNLRFNSLPFNCQWSKQLKLNRADAITGAFPLRNLGYLRCGCFSAKLWLSFFVKSPAYLTRSLIPGGACLVRLALLWKTEEPS